jgi:hypothetical protein
MNYSSHRGSWQHSSCRGCSCVCVCDGCLGADELCKLTRLTGLTNLALTYSSISTAANAAAAWGTLPLKQLSIAGISESWRCERSMRLPASAIQQLSGVTSLTLSNCKLGGEMCAAIATECTALQELSLQQCWGVSAAALAALAAQLQLLRRLDVTGTVSNAAELARLSRMAPQLLLEARSLSESRFCAGNARESQMGGVRNSSQPAEFAACCCMSCRFWLWRPTACHKQTMARVASVVEGPCSVCTAS